MQKPKANSLTIILTLIITVALIVLVFASWIFNPGWLRVFLTILLIPIWHAIFVLVCNLIFCKYYAHSKKMLIFGILFNLLYLISYLLLPDFGDMGELKVFFWLIESNSISYAAWMISIYSLIGHLTCFILQIVFSTIYKKKLTQAAKSDFEEAHTEENSL